MLILLAKADYTHPNPSPGQQEAGNYPKRKIDWRGLTISIENEKGAVRSGTASDGTTWSRPMYAAYGYINRTMGVDGDQVDVYLGPDLSAPNVYIVHQRKYGDWDKYDEDKVMLGWTDEASARAAYLKQYDDPRFLGPITAMSAETFVEKVKATRDKPAMLKSVVVLLKGYVQPHIRQLKGKAVLVSGYATRNMLANPDQLDMFSHAPAPAAVGAPKPGAAPTAATATRGHYATVVRSAGTPRQRVGWLAGPFASEEEARAHLPAAKAKARELDPWTDFDAFGTASREAMHHPPGVLNRHLGL